MLFIVKLSTHQLMLNPVHRVNRLHLILNLFALCSVYQEIKVFKNENSILYLVIIIFNHLLSSNHFS